MASWDPARYLQYEQQRTQPSRDLAVRIPLCEAADVLDIGCGPGNSTAVLAQRCAGANVLGVDSAPQMIEAARAACPGMQFMLADAAEQLPLPDESYDVVFSNAAIQWMPNHQSLLPGWMRLLRRGGALAVQTPMNQDAPVQRIIADIAQGERWKGRFTQNRIFHNLQPEAYYTLLAGQAASFEMWSTTYYHVLPSQQAVLEWYRGTGLRPYLDALADEPEASAEFERQLMDGIRREYPAQPDGSVIFPFPRLFFVAVK